MKKLVYSLLFISTLSFAQEEKNVGDFTKVTAFDKIEVNLIAGSENKVILSGDNSEEVELINKNGELKIRMPFTKMLSGEDISVTVYYTNLEGVEANEGSKITSEDEIETINFDIICKEGAQISIENLKTDRLQVRTSAGSIVTIKGTAKNQDILSNSGGKYEGKECESEQTTVTVNAGGSAYVNASNFVDAKTRAGGEIIIYGKPKQINQKTIAGGTIQQAK